MFLLFAGALGGAINAVAGGRSFISFPALLFTGVPPIPANATNTLALWVGTTASGGAYPQKLNLPRRIMIPLVVTSVVGGLAGAFLLIKTPAQTFLQVLPWLLLGATLLFAFGKHVIGHTSMGISHDASSAAVTGAFHLRVHSCHLRRLFRRRGRDHEPGDAGGAGHDRYSRDEQTQGDPRRSHQWRRNAYVYCHGGDSMAAGVVMTVGAILGGYSNAHYAQKLPQAWVRAFVILVGTPMTIYFFIRGYR